MVIFLAEWLDYKVLDVKSNITVDHSLAFPESPLHSLGTFIYSQNLFNEALKWLVVLATKECLYRFHLLTASILLFQTTVASILLYGPTASPMKRLLHFEMATLEI